jgi:hypothetical protein
MEYQTIQIIENGEKSNAGKNGESERENAVGCGWARLGNIEDMNARRDQVCCNQFPPWGENTNRLG